MIIDGSRIEDRSIALIKLKVDISTAEDLNNFKDYVEGMFVHRGTDTENPNGYDETINGNKTFAHNVDVNGNVTVDSDVSIEGNLSTLGNTNVTGNMVIEGNLHVSGTTTEVFSENTVLADNEIILNKNEVGPGVTHTSGRSGISIFRGGGANESYLFGFRESDDTLVAGFASNLRRVAFEEDIENLVGQLAGDVTGDVDNNTVVKIQNKNVIDPGTMTDNYVMRSFSDNLEMADPSSFLDAKTINGHTFQDIVNLIDGNDDGESGGVVATDTASFPGDGSVTAINLSGDYGVTFPDDNYQITITPEGDTSALVGEFWVDNKDGLGFEVYNSGSGTTTFRWAVSVEGGMPSQEGDPNVGVASIASIYDPPSQAYYYPGSHTYTVPAGVELIKRVAIIGAGGGGAGGHGGGGGAGGAAQILENIPVTPGSSINLSVGTGGEGQFNVTSDVRAQSGENSQITLEGNTYISYGGQGGRPYATTSGTVFGTGAGGGTGGYNTTGIRTALALDGGDGGDGGIPYLGTSNPDSSGENGQIGACGGGGGTGMSNGSGGKGGDGARGIIGGGGGGGGATPGNFGGTGQGGAAGYYGGDGASGCAGSTRGTYGGGSIYGAPGGRSGRNGGGGGACGGGGGGAAYMNSSEYMGGSGAHGAVMIWV